MPPSLSHVGPLAAWSQPNPSRGAADISFTLPTAADVTVRVYDVDGRMVAAPLAAAR